MIDALYTTKQLEILKRVYGSDWFMLILHGAKRSGKTKLNNDLFLQEVLRVKAAAKLQGVHRPMYILSGASLGMIDKNILTELHNSYGLEFGMDKFNNFNLFGVKIVQVGHSKISGVDNIRGMTAWGAYVNEASLANPEVFDEIKSRCSGEGARILVDTNTDNPEHWLKKDYIDNPDPMIISYGFTLWDNTQFLGERYINNMVNTTPTGVFTDRNIWGLWVTGEGTVLSDYSTLNEIVSTTGLDFVRYFAGVDWGFEHYGVIGVFGVTIDGYIIKIAETWSQHKGQDHWLAKAKLYMSEYGYDIPFFCDTARPDLISFFRENGVNAKLADKRVLPGIEYLSRVIKSRKLKVVATDNSLWLKNVYSYRWNPKTGEPIKENDDSIDMTRYAVFSDYMMIKNIKKRARNRGAVEGLVQRYGL